MYFPEGFEDSPFTRFYFQFLQKKNRFFKMTFLFFQVKLLEAQPALADMIPATGYLSRILSSINSMDNKNIQKPGVLIINKLSR